MAQASDIGARIVYGRVGPGFYEHNRDILDASNCKTLTIIAIVAFAIDLVFSLLCFTLIDNLPNALSFLGFTIALGILAGLNLTYLKDHQDQVDIFYYLLYALAFTQTLLMSTVMYPDSPMVSIYFIIVMLPVLHIEKPIRSYLTVIVSCAIALVCVFAVKPDPSIRFDDTLAMLFCLAASLPFIALVRGINLSNIEAMQYYQVKAEIDRLTGVCNHESCEILIRNALAEHEGPCTLFVIDIDDFKSVNDTMGHIHGDKVLAAVGEVLRECFRQGDVIGRIGGDEFVVFMTGTDSLDIIARKAKSVQIGLGEIMSDLTTRRITCSIGVAARTESLNDFKSLFEAADKALYWAKSAGKNRYEIFRERRRVFDRNLPLMLIADDAEDSRAILRACFQNEFNIVEATDGQQALDMVRDYGIELAIILLDVRMPVVDGKEVIRVIRANHRFAGIPIVVITAYDENELTTLQLGANDMLEKPFDPEVCRIRVRNAIAAAAK